MAKKPKEKTITIADILAYGPCSRYTPEHLAELFAGREAMTALEIMETDIPVDHKLDCLLRSGLIPPKKQKRLRDRESDRVKEKRRTEIQRGKKHQDSDGHRLARITADDASAAEVVCVAHIEKCEPGMTREQRRTIIEAEAARQLAELLGDADDE